MKKGYLVKLSLTIVFLLIFSSIAFAGMVIPASDKAREHAQAPEKSPVISEGSFWDLERVNFIHYVKPEAPGKPDKSTVGYDLMGVKWNTFPVNYVINTDNNEGLTAEFIKSAISESAETWDDATLTTELFNNNYTLNSNLHYGVQDYNNTMEFGALSNNNIIAITSIWFNRRTKEIIEFDILFNEYFAWGDAEKNPELMDLRNIAVHELGHGVGLNDIYKDNYSYVSMYGYSGEGEVIKRTLEQPDITGLQIMYGK